MALSKPAYESNPELFYQTCDDVVPAIGGFRPVAITVTVINHPRRRPGDFPSSLKFIFFASSATF